MKIQNIYHLLQAALLLLLVVSCTQEEFPAAQDKALQLTISVTDGGYTSTEGKTTRAVENGYTTEFTEGDACGFYMVRGGKPVYSNVKLTAEKDAATGGIMWKTDGTTLAAGMDGESYYLYYPYQADMAGKTATPAEGAVMTDAEFFKQPCRFLPVVCRAEREAKVSRSVQVLEQAVLLKDRRPAEVARVRRAAVRTLQPQQNAQQRRFADAGAARDAREADFGGKAHALQHRRAAVAFAEIFHPKLHQAHHLSVSASTPRRNSPSNKTESSTITAVHAKRSAV